jgi:hypothetical protein
MMKAFLMAIALLAIVTAGAAASVGFFQTSAKDAFTQRGNVRL